MVLPALVDGHIHLDKTLLGLPWVPNQAAGNRVADRIEAERRVRRQSERCRSRKLARTSCARSGQRHAACAATSISTTGSGSGTCTRSRRCANSSATSSHPDRGLPAKRHPAPRLARAECSMPPYRRNADVRRPRPDRHRRRPRRPSRRDLRHRPAPLSASTSICTMAARPASPS